MQSNVMHLLQENSNPHLWIHQLPDGRCEFEYMQNGTIHSSDRLTICVSLGMLPLGLIRVLLTAECYPLITGVLGIGTEI